MGAGALDTLRRAEVVDLTHTLRPDFPLFPVYNPVEVAERFSVGDDGFFVRRWSFDEHCGTHVDAPAHFAAEGATVDRLDPADLVLAVAVIDVRGKVAGDDDALIEPDDVLGWERRHGRLPDRCAVFALTGWGTRAGDAAAYLNADEGGTLHSPGFSVETADFLREDRPEVRAIGLDTASLDIGASADFAAHVSWLPSGRYGIENLANLERLPESGAVVCVGAPTFQGGSGGPARVLALLT
ncbi:cyclase family protein [soil metagenome]|jgi:kynurenine formamidase|nr:cyclase family protein [Thermoleophilaceae bacterium]MDQ3240899.1 cyclase family protein [Actinomycetota bacterium]MDQ3320103.1 cyclase family protein [Actinomycetota bacterium]MDQ3356803.1 cyclase family protein [Actinomycetota bacterium]